MPSFESLISRGYFHPHELPPAFSSVTFSSLRRKLGIPNPILFYQLARCVVDNWSDLQRHAAQSPYSLTTPVDGYIERAIARPHGLTERPIRRAQLRSTSRYILVADINRFYPSLYTQYSMGYPHKAYRQN